MASSSSASKLNSNTALAFAAGAAAAAALVGGIAWLRGSGKDDAEQEEESVRVSKAALARLEAHSAACNRVLDTLFDALDKNGDGGITIRELLDSLRPKKSSQQFAELVSALLDVPVVKDLHADYKALAIKFGELDSETVESQQRVTRAEFSAYLDKAAQSAAKAASKAADEE